MDTALRIALSSNSEDALKTIESTLESTSKTYRSNKNILSFRNISNGSNVYQETCPICGQGYLQTDEDIEEDTENLETIYSSQIITTPERRFISDTELNTFNEVSNNYMDYRNYIGDTGVYKVNHAYISDEALSVKWDNIIDRPNITYNEVEDLVTNTHSHINLDALDKLSIDTNTKEPLWNNEGWPYPKVASSNSLDRPYIRNTIIDNKSTGVVNDKAYVGDIYFQVDYNTDDIVSINIKYNRNKYYTLSIENILLELLDRIEAPVKKIINDEMIVDHEELDHLQGGSRGEYYHLTEDEYNTLRRMIIDYRNASYNPSEGGFPIKIVR